MAITINDNSPRKQYSASSGQTNFAGTWRIEDEADIEVYQTLAGIAPDDTTDILVNPTNYTVTGVGVGNSFTVILNVGAATGDIITIVGEIDFSAIYNFLTNQNFNPADFNVIFSKWDRELKQLRMETRKLQPKYQNSEQVIAKDYKLPQLAANQSWRMDETNAEIEAVVLGIVGPGETWYGVTTGIDTYLVTITDFTGYTVGEIIFLQFGSSNTGASTININGLGGKSLVNTNGIAFVAGDLVAGVTYTFIFHDDKYYLFGLGQKATTTEVETGTDNFKYVTPKTLKAHSGNVFFVDTAGAANVYTGTITGMASYYTGLTLEILINTTNTGASTLNINGLGAITLQKADGSAMQAGDLVSGAYYMVIYTGSVFRLFKRPQTEDVLMQQVRLFDAAFQNLGVTVIPFDVTIPQITEGTQIMSQAFTPLSTTSKVLIEITIYSTTQNAGGSPLIAALFKDAGVNSLVTGCINVSNADEIAPIVIKYLMTPGSTTPFTLTVRLGGPSGNILYNGGTLGALFNGTYFSSMIITEYNA